MRLAHRRVHLLVWLLLAPAIAWGVFLALAHRPADPVTDLPPSIAEDAP